MEGVQGLQEVNKARGFNICVRKEMPGQMEQSRPRHHLRDTEARNRSADKAAAPSNTNRPTRPRRKQGESRIRH